MRGDGWCSTTTPVTASVAAPVTTPVPAPVTTPVTAPVTSLMAAPVTTPVPAPRAAPSDSTRDSTVKAPLTRQSEWVVVGYPAIPGTTSGGNLQYTEVHWLNSPLYKSYRAWTISFFVLLRQPIHAEGALHEWRRQSSCGNNIGPVLGDMDGIP